MLRTFLVQLRDGRTFRFRAEWVHPQERMVQLLCRQGDCNVSVAMFHQRDVEYVYAEDALQPSKPRAAWDRN